jgi:cytochrome c-type biogenesis protein CcmH
MTAFIVIASTGVFVVLALLLRPLFGVRAGGQASQRELNASILREQLAKLDQDLAEGSLRQEDYTQARAELQRRVLEDTNEEDAVPTLRAPKRTLIAIALLVPLAATALYAVVGSPNGIGFDPASQARAQQDVERMVQSLADKLAKEPGNAKGWVMLARSYKVMGRMRDAESAFEHAGAFIDDDAEALAEYADVAVTNAKGSFVGKPGMLLEKALKADPQNGMALWLAGTAAMNAQDYERAIALWERLAPMLQPASEEAENLRASILEARGLAGGGGISGTVELAAALKAKASPSDTVMVIARVPGTRMPLAVLRVKASDLPMKFTLDDSLSMSPQARLSGATQVEVEARVSKSGQAQPLPGDLISAVQVVKVGAKSVALEVTQVRQ